MRVGKLRLLTRVALCLFALTVAWGGCAWTPGASAQTRPRAAQPKSDPARWRAALGRVTADDLRTHLKYIASDELEGRKTPSRGLDLAAEYIAKQFRTAGLEPIGDDGYFQTASGIL